MAYFRSTYPQATVPIKMHMLEDHTVQWANQNHVGLLMDCSAESSSLTKGPSVAENPFFTVAVQLVMSFPSEICV